MRANWITEWYAYDRGVLDALGLSDNERIAGFVHIGPSPPEDRPATDSTRSRPASPADNALARPHGSERSRSPCSTTPRKNDHGLPRDPFKAIVAPRPIGWITSMSANGEINLAPYSFFNAVSDAPPIVLFSSEGPKDSLVFVEETREFVCNLATFDLRDAVVETSAQFPRGVNEMEQSGLAAAPVALVRPPRVAASPCALECKLLQIIDLKDLDGKPADRYRRARTGGRHPHRRPLHQGRPRSTPRRCSRSRAAVTPTTPSSTRCSRLRGPPRHAGPPPDNGRTTPRRTLRWRRPSSIA